MVNHYNSGFMKYMNRHLECRSLVLYRPLVLSERVKLSMEKKEDNKNV
jgi:hypothetical protein